MMFGGLGKYGLVLSPSPVQLGHESQSTPDSASVKTDELVTMWIEIRDRAWERVNSDEKQGIYVSHPIQDALSCMNDILDSVEPS